MSNKSKNPKETPSEDSGTLCPNPECRSISAPDKRFCADCGTAITERLSATTKQDLERLVRQEVELLVNDQKVVEVETTVAIAERLVRWAKTIGWVAGIFVALLAFLGYKTYSDFSNRIKAQGSVLIGKLSKQEEQIAKRGDEVIAKYNTYDEQLSTIEKEFPELRRQLDTLNQDVKEELSKIRDKLADIEGDYLSDESPLPPSIREQTEAAFTLFRHHLLNLGAKEASGKVVIVVDSRGDGKNIFYDKKRIVVGEKVVRDRNGIFSSYATHILISVRPDAWNSFRASVNSLFQGLSNYLACSFDDDPYYGREFARALGKEHPQVKEVNGILCMRYIVNTRQIADVKTLEIHDGGEIWAGAFWELRKRLGRDAADRLLFDAWQTVDFSSTEFPDEFLQQLLVHERRLTNSKHVQDIIAVFKDRGLELEGDETSQQLGSAN